MATNKFATLIHRKTNRITLILIYVFLEWSLIFFILVNSLFNYLIRRFADYFGLKRPCLFCSRLDRFFDDSGKSPSNRDLFCDDHVLEISKVGFSYSYSKPVDESNVDFGESHKDRCCVEKTSSLIESDFGILSHLIGDEGQICNGVEFANDSQEETEEKKISSENSVIEIVPQFPGKIEEEATVDDDDDEFSCYISSFDCNKELRVEKEEENKVDLAMEAETAPKNLEFYIDEEDCHLIPVEFCEEVREISDINGDFILDFVAEPDFMAAEEASKPEDTVTNLDESVKLQSDDEDTDAEASIGTEIPVYEQMGDTPSQQLNPDEEDDHVEDTLEFRTITNINEERFLETPSSLERSHSLHNTMFHLEPRVSGTESQDGIECLEGVLTVDKLKLELEEERKVLNALYEELEEERSASAVAASETMAMINRLQEEKAAMQMEALQYQRMMEEQSEFDQEALQLLNELLVNREKENTKLEKELEMCRKRVEEYETKEKMGMLRRRKSDSSVDSYRNNGDSDENNNEVSDWKHRENEMENTPVDVVRSFDECLDDYEGERLSILGRLKFLEEKLTDLNNEDDEEKEVKTLENGNGQFHGKETNGKHRIIKSKRLLPLFDAVDGEIQNGLSNGNHHENGSDDSEKEQIMMLEEEVDEVYERLEALEADREFLRHCVGSLKKGDKGVHLLHEILQHLRDLKTIDHRENGDMSF